MLINNFSRSPCRSGDDNPAEIRRTRVYGEAHLLAGTLTHARRSYTVHGSTYGEERVEHVRTGVFVAERRARVREFSFGKRVLQEASKQKLARRSTL